MEGLIPLPIILLRKGLIFMSYQYGELIDLSKISLQQINVIDEILDIIPVKFNGIEEKYQVCAPHEKEYTLMVHTNENGDIGYIYIDKDCKGLNLLADII